MTGKIEPQLLTVAEFAAAANVSIACTRRWILERRLTVVKLGRCVRIPSTELDRLIAEGTRPRCDTGR